MATTIQTERFRDFCYEAAPLFEAHWKEIAHFQDVVELNPRWEEYFRLDNGGTLLSFTVRDEGTLVGYAVYFTSRPLHYGGDVFGVNDMIYLSPEYRNRSLADQLIRTAEDVLSGYGVSVIQYHFKPEYDLSPLFARHGYHHHEIIYAKFVGDGHG